MRAESGTCNVCAAPCTSCMHFNRAKSCMEVKTEDEFSDESSRVKAASHCSFNDAKVLSPFKNKVRRDWQHTGSETSNLLSASSSPDTFSENSQNKTTLGTSEASEDAEMLQKVCLRGTSAMNKLLSKKAITSSTSHQQKGLDCDSDSISCISGANDGKVFDVVQSDDLEQKTVACNSTSVSDSVPEPGGCASKVKSQLKRAFSQCENEESWNKSAPLNMVKKEPKENDPTVPSETKDGMGMENNSCCQNKSDPSERCGEQTESSMEKSSSAQKSIARTSNDDILTNIENCKTGLGRSSSSGSMKIHPCSESGAGTNNAEQAVESMKCSTLDEKAQKLNVSPELSNTHEPLQSQANDEANESELEDDVKVCDICGDAGREESLAFCSRCSDGAEHTYCMRVMVDKVPEGDWLCEECMIKEEAEKQKLEDQKQDKLETELGSLKTPNTNGKSQIAGNSEHLPKMDAKSLDAEANRSIKAASSSLSSFKRRLESLEVAPAAKRQTLESGVGTPKSSSPSKKLAMSREASFKNFEKGKAKPFHITPLSGGNVTNCSQGISNSPTSFGSNSSKTQSLLQSPRGTFLRSNSFNMNSKPKVKLVDESVCQKQKLIRDRAGNDTKKDGVVRTMNKSQSFRTASSRSTSTEAKVKLHSSGSFRTEDDKGLKLSKERSIERKSSLKSDRCLTSSSAGLNSSASKAEQKMTCRGENSSMLSPGGSYRDSKAVQVDGKLNNSVKTSSLSANNGEALAGRGDFKRQSSMLSRGTVPLSSNGNPEQKPSQVNQMEEPATSFVTDRLTGDSDAIQLDVLSQSRELANQDTKIIEASFSQSKQNSAGGDKTIRCHLCKEIGHAAQFCSAGNSHTPVLEASGSQNSREVRHKNTKLKDSVEAALQKRSVMNKKSKVRDYSDEFSVSSTELGNEVASNDQPLAPSNDVKSQTSQPTEANGERESDAFAPSEGYKSKDSMNDLTCLASSISIPQEPFYIPEHNYIWQGGFHVKRSGRPMELCDGIQGHLSTSASPKVREVASRFLPRVTLEEVSRLTTWPTQFQKCATEDNIALYFFAKDHESYAKSYKRLLENMMKSDLALKANFDGVELLIFPSTVLPEKSQHWNMLFFLWGVFKGKRTQGSDTISSYDKNLSGANKNMPVLERELPDQVHPDSHKGCAGNIDDLTTSGKLSGTEKVTESSALTCLTIPYSGVDLNCSTEESPIDDEHSGLKSCNGTGCDANVCNPLSKMVMDNAEPKGIDSHTEEYNDCESKGNSSVLPTQGGSVGNGQVMEKQNWMSKATLADSHTIPLDRQDASFGSFKVFPASIYAAQDSGALGIKVVEKIQPKMQNTSCDMKYEYTAEQEVRSDSRIATMCTVTNDAEERGDDRRKVESSRKRMYSASLETGMEAHADACTSSTSQEMPFYATDDCILIEEDGKFKKMRWSNSETNAGVSSRDENSYSARMHNGRSFPINVNDLDEAYGDTAFPRSSGTAERHLFPVDSCPVNDYKPRGNFIPVQVLSSDDEDQPEEPGAPNLELALGGERRPSKPGALPLFAGLADRNFDHGKQPDIATENRDDDLSSSLSLSLAFPFPDKEQSVQRVPKAEQLLPERRVDTSLFLFGSFRKP
ncbi:hypothetical protein Syun_018354 [Stephania yunnanensis]|uniref:PHD-type domain-containing protein n=1 Tax=Stephania yunnanensis TaxID=152371 RepID=A0AAP0IU00_9MAGN